MYIAQKNFIKTCTEKCLVEFPFNLEKTSASLRSRSLGERLRSEEWWLYMICSLFQLLQY